jgi:serine phosphatase RsbU (regulator of sigma subunit)
MFNLPRTRFLDPPRPLRGSVADLEALVGHAVVLEDTVSLPHWRCPEVYPSAVCVPVSSPTVPLGTLWCYSKTGRDFTSDQTNLLEIVAGRIAADLEREMLLNAGIDSQTTRRNRDAANLWRKDRLPQFPPQSAEWDLAGWCSDSELGDEFYEWTVLPDGRIAFTLAAVNGDKIAAPLNAAGLQVGWRTQATYQSEPAQLLTRLNESLWSSSAGDLRGMLAVGAVDDHGLLEFALAGNMAGCLLRKEQRIVLGSGVHTLLPPLGLDGDTRYVSQRWSLDRGDLLLLLSPAACAVCDEAGLRIGEASLFQTLQRKRNRPADQIATVLKEALQRRLEGDRRAAFVIVKRRGK